MTGSFQHGHAEQVRPRRDRERDRRGRASSQPPPAQFIRFNAVGEQETQDWLQALETVTHRLETFQRNVTTQTTSMAQHSRDLAAVSNQVDNDVMDL